MLPQLRQDPQGGKGVLERAVVPWWRGQSVVPRIPKVADRSSRGWAQARPGLRGFLIRVPSAHAPVAQVVLSTRPVECTPGEEPRTGTGCFFSAGTQPGGRQRHSQCEPASMCLRLWILWGRAPHLLQGGLSGIRVPPGACLPVLGRTSFLCASGSWVGKCTASACEGLSTWYSCVQREFPRS